MALVAFLNQEELQRVRNIERISLSGENVADLLEAMMKTNLSVFELFQSTVEAFNGDIPTAEEKKRSALQNWMQSGEALVKFQKSIIESALGAADK